MNEAGAPSPEAPADGPGAGPDRDRDSREVLRGRLSPPGKRALDPASPLPLRQMAAKGVLPGAKPGDALATVVLLADQDDEPGTTAKATLRDLPPQVRDGALSAGLSPELAHVLAPYFVTDAATAAKILATSGLFQETAALFAQRGNEAVTELVATNEERLLLHPLIIEKLYMNPATRMSTADRIVELAIRNHVELTGIPAWKETALAIGQIKVPPPAAEPTPEDIHFRETAAYAAKVERERLEGEDTHVQDEATGAEEVKPKYQPLYARLAAMNVSQKIRRATLGNASERAILIRDSNKLVAAATAKSPGIQENEVEMIAANRSVSDDVLRIIAQSREWTRSHTIRLRLVQNPRTPLVHSARLVALLRDHELKALAKNKNVPGTIAQMAQQHLSKKKTK